MKKLIAAVLVLAMSLAMFAGCAKEETTTEATTETASGTAKTIAKEDMIVGFIYVGPIGDGGYTYAHDQGRLYLEEQLGVKTIYKESVPETQEVESEVRNMIDQGAKAIFATSYGYMDYIEKISAEFPDVAFFHCSGYKTTDNMANYFGRIYQPRYLSGIVAAMKSESKVLGYVGAFPIPEVISGINAFTLGAQSIDPEITVKVVWTNTWYDPAKEKDAAVSLINAGADVIAQHQDTAGPQQAAEEAGVWSIGYNTDMSAMAPGAYMTAPIWNWGPYYVEQTQAVMDGTFKSHVYYEGMDKDIVRLAPLTANAPAEAQAMIDDLSAKMIDGSFKVFSGPIYDQNGELKVKEGEFMSDADILSNMWFVKGVDGIIE